MSSYAENYELWREAPNNWWLDAAEAIDWIVPPKEACSLGEDQYGVWYPGAKFNIVENCLDRHVAAGRGEQAALVWESGVTGKNARISYAELTNLVARFAGALRRSGVREGDRVLIYMPMIPQAVIAMLASARIGAVHSVVFGGFAPAELAARIADCTPKAIVVASCGIEPNRTIAYEPLIQEAIALSGHQPNVVFMAQRPELIAKSSDYEDFDQALNAEPIPPVAIESTAPLYILYTSGTTGKPKGIVRDCGGYAVALQRSMGMVYGASVGDTVWAASDIGWVVGHSYIVYGPLLAGCTTVLYEGKPVGTPDAGAFWRICADHKVKMLFTAPTAIRAIRQIDPDGKLAEGYDLSYLKSVFLAGERCDPSTANWLRNLLDRPVIDHWWQTETGWPITAGFWEYGLLEFPAGCGGRAAPGWQVESLDKTGTVLKRGSPGELAIKLPLPPGSATTLWNNDTAFFESYLSEFPGWFKTGDAGQVDPNGNVWIMGRTDDIINVAGHRLSTGAMEEVLASHPDVAECAVVGLFDQIKGQLPVGFVTLKSGASTPPNQIVTELVNLVRERIGAVAAFKQAIIVPRLPRTRSGKILRKLIRQIGDGDLLSLPPTIEDGSVVAELEEILKQTKITDYSV